MKRWRIGLLAVVVAVFVIVGTVGAMMRVRVPTRPAEESDVQRASVAGERAAVEPARAAARPQVAVDPNRVIATIKTFKGLEEELDKADTKGKGHMRNWLSETQQDNRLALLKGTDDQVELELSLLRKLAAEEGAKKTVAAIDGILLHRMQRQDSVIERLRADRKESLRTRNLRGRTRSRTDTRSGYQQGGTTGGVYQQPVEQEDSRRTTRRRY